MAFSVQPLTTKLLRRTSPSSAARGFCLFPPLEPIDSCLRDLKTSVSPTLLSLKTSFLSPATDAPKTSISLHAAGIFLQPGLIATSARSVARVATSYVPRTTEKPDRFNHGSIRYKPEIGTTVALTAAGKALETKPLAVSFSRDLAVLKAVISGGETFPHCPLANSPLCRNDALISIPLGNFDSEPVAMMGRVMATGERRFSGKPPWPVEDRPGWVEHTWVKYRGGQRPETIWGEKLDDSAGKLSGSPWFNFDCEVVGIASWEAVDKDWGDLFGFAVPCSWIRDVVDYAKKKAPEDPVVMDSWVDSGMD